MPLDSPLRRPGPPLLLRTRAGALHRAGERGFVLPLAISAALVALLGSLSVQSAALQSRLDQAGRLGLRHQEDSLAAAAQQLVGRLNRLHPCLLPLPMADWSMEGLGCVAPHQVEALKQGLHDDGAWRLLDWHPGQGSAVALLELVPASQRLRPRRARFAVVLQGEPLRAQSLRLLGLRGVEP